MRLHVWNDKLGRTALRCAVTFLLALASCGGSVSPDLGSDAGSPEPDSHSWAADADFPLPDATGEDGDDVDSPPVISASICRGPGNVIALWGDEGNTIYETARLEEPLSYPTGVLVRDGTWSLETHPSRRDWIGISVDAKRSFWDLYFGTDRLTGRDLAVGKYTDVQRAVFAEAGHAGLDVAGDAVGCNEISGEFTITQADWDVYKLKAFTASFVEYCDSAKTVLRGCVHFEQS